MADLLCPVCMRNPNRAALPNDLVHCSTCGQMLQLLPNGFAILSKGGCEALTPGQLEQLRTKGRAEPIGAVAIVSTPELPTAEQSDRERAVHAWCAQRGISFDLESQKGTHERAQLAYFKNEAGTTMTLAIPVACPDALEYIATVYCVDGSPVARLLGQKKP